MSASIASRRARSRARNNAQPWPSRCCGQHRRARSLGLCGQRACRVCALSNHPCVVIPPLSDSRGEQGESSRGSPFLLSCGCAHRCSCSPGTSTTFWKCQAPQHSRPMKSVGALGARRWRTRRAECLSPPPPPKSTLWGRSRTNRQAVNPALGG